MKILKILFLISSLLTLSCEKMEQDKKKSLVPMDSDGDLIPDYMDEDPFVAQNPLAEIKFKLILKNGDQTQEIQLKESNPDLLYEYVSTHYRKDGLNYDYKFTNLDFIFKDNLSPQTEVNLSYSAKEMNDIRYELKLDQKILSSSQLTSNKETKFQINLSHAKNKKLSLNVKNFYFDRNFQTFSYQDFLNSVNQKSYKLTLIGLKEKTQHFVSSELSLTDALLKFGFSQFDTDEILNRGANIFLNDVSTLGDKDSGWVILNLLDQRKISPGSHIIMVEINKKIIENYQRIITNETLDFYSPDIKLDISNSREMSFKINGVTDFYQQSNVEKKATYVTGYDQISIHKCLYNISSLIEKKMSLSNFNLFQMYDVFLDAKKIEKFSMQGDSYKFPSQGHKILEFKLKNNFRGKVYSGITESPRQRCHFNSFYPEDNRDHQMRHDFQTHDQLINNEIRIEIEKLLLPQ